MSIRIAFSATTITRLCYLLISMALLSACTGSVRAPVSGQGLQARTHTHQSEQRTTRNVTHYRVRGGDTLYAIAWRYGQDFRELARWNNIRPPYTIYPGQRLRLTPRPPPRHLKAVARPSANSEGHKREPGHVHADQNRVKTRSGRQADRPLKWRWPARGRVVKLQSPLGRKGIDIRGKRGQKILAAESGEVVYSGSGLIGYGQLIIIKHNDRYLSAYAHNSSLYVKEGTRVRAGQKIAAMGRSGNDIVGLHFEIRRNGKPVPPLHYLPRK